MNTAPASTPRIANVLVNPLFVAADLLTDFLMAHQAIEKEKQQNLIQSGNYLRQ